MSQNKKLLALLAGIIPAFLLAAGLLAHHAFGKNDKVVYVPVTSDLKITEPGIALEPRVSREELLEWTAARVTDALSLDFLSLKKQLMDSRAYFEPKAHESFLGSLEKGGHLKKITAERLGLKAEVDGTPEIVKVTMSGGRADWTVKMPLVLEYHSSQRVVFSGCFLGEIVVRKVSPRVSRGGLVIKQIVLTVLPRSSRPPRNRETGKIPAVREIPEIPAIPRDPPDPPEPLTPPEHDVREVPEDPGDAGDLRVLEDLEDPGVPGAARIPGTP
ncbi:MAG: DotI/IcmL family type IV secretion protein [Deltaproteobacteria bacterium]|nr:DotI/IcmL family type IV secretion protein [Deltaproteobacteria bacterium]